MPTIIAIQSRLRIGLCLCWLSPQRRTFKEDIQAAECLVRVNRVGLTVRRSLPVYPDERTFSDANGMSQRCHFRTHALQQRAMHSRAGGESVYTTNR